MTDLGEFDDVVNAVRSGLAAVEYGGPTPVQRRRATATRTLAGALAVVAAAAALVVLGPWGRSGAAWAAHPRALTADQEARIIHACTTLGHLDPAEATPLPPPAVIDWRGNRVIAFFAGDDRMVDCVLGPFTGEDFLGGGGVSGEYTPADLKVVDDDPYISYRVGAVETTDGYRFATLVARADPQVQRVTVLVPGRGEAEASIDGGWVSIWWPGDVDGAALRAYDARDRLVAHVALTLE